MANKINLAEEVMGSLPAANGGTGQTSMGTGLVTSAGTAAFGTVAAPAGTVVGTTDTQTLSSKTLTSPVVNTGTFTGYTETVQAVGTVTTTKTLPALSGGTLMTCLLTAADTCVFTMPTAAAGASFMLAVQQASTPTGLATFTGVLWPGAITPVVTAIASYFDVFTFFCFDGTHWRGSYAQGYSA